MLFRTRPAQAPREADVSVAGPLTLADRSGPDRFAGPGSSGDSTLRLISGNGGGPDRSPDQPLSLQTIELLCSPFRSFREIGHFHQTVAGLPGVRAVQPRRVQDGTFQIRVECARPGDLLHALAEAYDVPFEVQRREQHRIEIALDHRDDADNPDLQRRGA